MEYSDPDPIVKGKNYKLLLGPFKEGVGYPFMLLVNRAVYQSGFRDIWMWAIAIGRLEIGRCNKGYMASKGYGWRSLGYRIWVRIRHKPS